MQPWGDVYTEAMKLLVVPSWKHIKSSFLIFILSKDMMHCFFFLKIWFWMILLLKQSRKFFWGKKNSKSLKCLQKYGFLWFSFCQFCRNQNILGFPGFVFNDQRKYSSSNILRTPFATEINFGEYLGMPVFLCN